MTTMYRKTKAYPRTASNYDQEGMTPGIFTEEGMDSPLSTKSISMDRDIANKTCEDADHPLFKLDQEHLLSGIILSEVLGRPKSRKNPYVIK